MTCKDWIDLFKTLLVAGVGIYFTFRLEGLRKVFARSLKRYDLLHTARFKVFEEADDALVEIQLMQFEAWKAIGREGWRNPNENARSHAHVQIAKLEKVVHKVAISKIKCEKFFDEDFNNKFYDLMGTIQKAEMTIKDVRDLLYLGNADQLKDAKETAMNEAFEESKKAIPAFRKLMGVRIQKDLED